MHQHLHSVRRPISDPDKLSTAPYSVRSSDGLFQLMANRPDTIDLVFQGNRSDQQPVHPLKNIMVRCLQVAFIPMMLLGALVSGRFIPTKADSCWKELRRPGQWKQNLPPNIALSTQALEDQVDAFLAHPNIRFHYFKSTQPLEDTRIPHVSDFKEATSPDDFKTTQKAIARDFIELLKHRPDLLALLQSRPFNINFYEGWSYLSGGWSSLSNKRPVGGETLHAGDIRLALQSAYNPNPDGHRSAIHELGHKLDLNNYNFDGLLPGWNPEEIKRFKAARTAELLKIKEGQSPLDTYASETHSEFLAVLLEHYFERPDSLKQSSPVLFEMMEDYFGKAPDQWLRPHRNIMPFVILGYHTVLFITFSGALILDLRDKINRPKEERDIEKLL